MLGVEPGDDAVSGHAQERRDAARAAGDRRRRPPLALPRGRRHRHRRARLSAGRAHLSASSIRGRTTTPRPSSTPPSGPFTLVPLPGQRSSLVWVLDPTDADDIAALDDAALAAEIERALAFDPRQDRDRARAAACFRSASPPPRRFGAQRIALVGEAAHVIPPIGAQGLNLGLRDAATIGELAVAAHRDGRDIGGADVLARLRENAPRRRRQPHARHRSAQSHAAHGLPAGAGPARPRALSARPHRPAAPRRDARRHRARARRSRG